MPIGMVPLEFTSTLFTLIKWQAAVIWLLAIGRFECKRRFEMHQALSASEQYRQHIQNGGYRP